MHLFIQLRVVNRHEAAKHASQKVYPCNKCPYVTTLAQTLKRHQERYCKNKNSNVFTYVCVHCNFKAEDLSTLEDHTLLTHPKKEILFCNICEFSTTESADLTEHAQAHLKNEPFGSDN
ncbi:hypothetical protein WA026_012798 [Henosepilachna vigintioctopunctata]|uniref:C2H2-type domain-containing protein n=1 Tax=Henosepilachna vigintioctopunctata TaxID=420089 RepID=A0AAW1U780_9CUCU